MLITSELKKRLFEKGMECFLPENHAHIADGLTFEAPCAIKSTDTLHKASIGAFSYAVSGFISETSIGRYCSIGENVQIGRGAHPTSWMSTSPFFYCYGARMFNVGNDYSSAHEYIDYAPSSVEFPHERNGRTIPDFLRATQIGHDVWIGHGAFIAQGVSIGTGAVVAGHSVVTKDVPPYAIVGGNPAQILSFRFTAKQIGRLLDLEWWRFAPWDLKGIDYPRIDLAIEQITDITRQCKPYNPGYTEIQSLL